MKKITFLLLGCMLWCTQLSLAQGLPDNTPCPIRPNSTTDPFDWRRPKYDLYLNKFDGLKTIESPWYVNLNNSNTNRFSLEPELAKDWDSAQGWEFVQRDFGAPDRNIPNAYLILYNRYRGILRIFVAIGDVDGQYNEAAIALSYGDGSKKTAILSNYSTRGAKSALDNFDNQVPPIAVANVYRYALPFWMYADFVMMYDPCTCNSFSRLRFDVSLISKSTLTFNVNGQVVQNLGLDGNGIGTDGKQSIVKNVGGAIEAGTGMYDKVEKGVATLDKIFKLTEKANGSSSLYKNGSFIYENLSLVHPREKTYKNILKALDKLPALGATAGVVDFMIGVFGATDTEPQPMMFDVKLKGEGEINFVSTPFNQEIYNPGSNYTPLIASTSVQYNKPMGVFNLVKTPVIKQYKGFSNSYYFKTAIHLGEDIQYVINPASDFSNIDVYASLVFEFTDNHPFRPGTGVRFTDFNGILIQQDENTYKTVDVPIACLKDLIVVTNSFRISLSPFYTTARPYINIKLFAKTPGAVSQELLFVYRYEAVVQNEDDMALIDKYTSEIRDYPQNRVFEDVDLSYASQLIYATDNIIVNAIDNITIGANVSMSNSINPFQLVAGQSITLKAGASLTPRLSAKMRYKLPSNCGSTSALGQATAQQIKAVCNSTAYTNLADGKNADGSRIAAQQLPKSISGISLDAYPNPFTGSTTITYSLPKAANVHVSVSDVLGKQVQILADGSYTNAGRHEIDFNAQKLAAGVYFYTLQVGDFKETKRLIIVR